MHCRVSRLIAVLLLSLCLVGSCWGEVEDGVKAQLEGDATVEVTADCNAENGECTNPDVVSDIPEAAQAVETETKTETSDVTEPALPEDPHCPSREYVIKCAGIYLDTNQNGKLEREELQSAIDKLPWYSRGILKILGSVDKMMTKCDIDGDGAIGMGYDMENNADQCLASCFKRRAFKGAFFPDCV